MGVRPHSVNSFLAHESNMGWNSDKMTRDESFVFLPHSGFFLSAINMPVVELPCGLS